MRLRISKVAVLTAITAGVSLMIFGALFGKSLEGSAGVGIPAESRRSEIVFATAVHATSNALVPTHHQNISEVPNSHDGVFGRCPTPRGNAVRLTRELIAAGVGWGGSVPSWIAVVCPEVVTHFNKFPYFRSHVSDHVSVMSTLYAAHGVCTTRVAARMAESVNSRMYLHAGSLLGALLHGGPIPWDDDMDATLNFDQRNEFIALCKKGHIVHNASHAVAKCTLGSNAIKFWVESNESRRVGLGTKPLKVWGFGPWRSPFVDIFLMRRENDSLVEVYPNGKRSKITVGTGSAVIPVDSFYPSQSYYFAGTTLYGPRSDFAMNRYKRDKCVMPRYNHRLESHTGLLSGQGVLDCCLLAEVLPFAYRFDSTAPVLSNQRATIPLPSSHRYEEDDPLWVTSREIRDQWLTANSSDGQRLTDNIPRLNDVEVDNSVTSVTVCGNASTGKLRVVEFNAERGKEWLQYAEHLRDADVVLLNEMDLGMARSDQQHTTRLLAFHLGMNYAFGLEFVELTLGTEAEQSANRGRWNKHGIHGNAILARCTLKDTRVFRDRLDVRYFSHARLSLNANGFEKRIGGRMGLFARVDVFCSPHAPFSSKSSEEGRHKVVALGSIHKVNQQTQRMRSYIGTGAAIVAGDQPMTTCAAVGLQHVNKGAKTWKASCNTLGRHHGDIICSNMLTLEAAWTRLPCQDTMGFRTTYSDHALTGVDFGL
jgi:hypothetical protein